MGHIVFLKIFSCSGPFQSGFHITFANCSLPQRLRRPGHPEPHSHIRPLRGWAAAAPFYWTGLLLGVQIPLHSVSLQSPRVSLPLSLYLLYHLSHPEDQRKSPCGHHKFNMQIMLKDHNLRRFMTHKFENSHLHYHPGLLGVGVCEPQSYLVLGPS